MPTRPAAPAAIALLSLALLGVIATAARGVADAPAAPTATAAARPATAVRRTLTLDGARAAADAALAAARSLGAAPSVAVVDDAGHLLAFLRADGSFAAGAEVSVGKARTAALFKKPTRAFEESINKGRYALLDAAGQPLFTPLQGGVPIEVSGEIVGAVGVSGAASAAQDEEIALAGAAALAAPSSSAQR